MYVHVHEHVYMYYSKFMMNLGTVHGQGTYFAVGAWYSHRDRYSTPDEKCIKHMLYCRVLVGDFSRAPGEDIMAPPMKNSPRSKAFDSTTNKTGEIKMFVIYESDQAYPQYLIRYKRV